MKNLIKFVTVYLLTYALLNLAWSLELDEEQEYVLNQFRPLALQIVDKEFMKTDGYLLRWLYAHDFDLENTLDGLRAALKWRADTLVDELMADDFYIVEKEIAFLMDGSVDYSGRPLLIQPVGAYDIRKLVLGGYGDSYAKFVTRLYEFQERLIFQNGIGQRNNTRSKTLELAQALPIIDMSGFSIRKTGCLSCIPVTMNTLSTLETYYPNLAFRLIFINVPTIFHSFLNTIKNLLSRLNNSGLMVFGYDKEEWSKVLLELIPPDQLLVQYGGTKQLGTAGNDSSSIQANANFLLWRERNQLILDKLLLEEQEYNKRHQDLADESSHELGSSPSSLIFGDNNETSTKTGAPSPPRGQGHQQRHRHRHHHHYQLAAGNSSTISLLGLSRISWFLLFAYFLTIVRT